MMKTINPTAAVAYRTLAPLIRSEFLERAKVYPDRPEEPCVSIELTILEYRSLERSFPKYEIDLTQEGQDALVILMAPLLTRLVKEHGLSKPYPGHTQPTPGLSRGELLVKLDLLATKMAGEAWPTVQEASEWLRESELIKTTMELAEEVQALREDVWRLNQEVLDTESLEDALVSVEDALLRGEK